MMTNGSNLLETITAQDVALSLPARANSSNVNKSSFGHIVVIGGSIGLLGAPVLAVHAAMRAGSGLSCLVPVGSLSILRSSG